MSDLENSVIHIIDSGENETVDDGGKQSNHSINDRRYVQLRRVTGDDLFEEFLNKCKQVVSAEEIDRAMEKIRKRFADVDPSYRDSPFFVSFLQRFIPRIAKEPWQCMKAISDELKHHSIEKSTKKQTANVTNVPVDNDTTIADKKTRKLIAKLEMTLHKLTSKIRSLEESEINFEGSDDENSEYIKVSRYKKRFCQVYNKLCELKKISGDETTQRIRFSGTRIPSVNRAIERFFDDKKEFPDFHDILNVVKLVSSRRNLGLSHTEIQETAKTAFQELGQTLKLRRQYEFHDIMCSYLPDHEDDPACANDELQQKLEENKRLHGNKIDELINKYATKQEEDHLEPVEVGSDEELPPSGSEDEEDDENESVTSISDNELTSTREEETSFRDCSVKLPDITKLPLWDKYRHRGSTSNAIEDYRNVFEWDQPCCSKSLLTRDMNQKRKRSDSYSSDDDTIEPKNCTVFVVASTSPSNTERYVEGMKICEKGNSKTEKTFSRNESEPSSSGTLPPYFLSESPITEDASSVEESNLGDSTEVVGCETHSSELIKDKLVYPDLKCVPKLLSIDRGIPTAEHNSVLRITENKVKLATEVANETENKIRNHNESNDVVDNDGRQPNVQVICVPKSNIENIELLPSGNATLLKSNVTVKVVTPKSTVSNGEDVENVPSGTKPSSSANADINLSSNTDDDDIVIINEIPSRNRSTVTALPANEIIDVDELENHSGTGISVRNSVSNSLVRRDTNFVLRNGMSVTSTSIRKRCPQLTNNIMLPRRMPGPQYTFRPPQSIRFMSSNNYHRRNMLKRRPAFASYRMQVNQALQTRTQTNEIRIVQNNQLFATKKTTTVEESFMRVAGPILPYGGTSTSSRNYSHSSTLPGSRPSTRTQYAAQPTRMRKNSVDEVVTLD